MNSAKATLSAIAYFLLLATLCIVYTSEVLFSLDEATLAAISFSSIYFIIYWGAVTFLLPLIAYPFFILRKEQNAGIGFAFIRHFFIVNFGFSVLGMLGIVYELIAKLL